MFNIFRSPVKTPVSSPLENKNHRGMPRFGVKWKVVAAIDGHTMYHGHTKDISLSGASILLPNNLSHAKFLDLHIHIPANHTEKVSRFLHIVGRLTYTIYDQAEKSFRAGIEFHEHKSVGGAEFLMNLLETHYRPIGQ